jgi:hypothetical protein
MTTLMKSDTGIGWRSTHLKWCGEKESIMMKLSDAISAPNSTVMNLSSWGPWGGANPSM